jgi:hypothetical protein
VQGIPLRFNNHAEQCYSRVHARAKERQRNDSFVRTRARVASFLIRASQLSRRRRAAIEGGPASNLGGRSTSVDHNAASVYRIVAISTRARAYTSEHHTGETYARWILK